MSAKKKLLVVEVAALGWDFLSRYSSSDFSFQKTKSIFPAVTCPVQASFRTASYPSEHGVVSNGTYMQELQKILFWEQSARLVEGDRIWNDLRADGKSVGMMFWQQSLGESVDFLLSPQPIHKHHGGMIQDGYSQPPAFYSQLISHLKKPFNLMHYWGPLAGTASSRWITRALMSTMEHPEQAPDLLFGYLPHLDYNLQRHGPESDAAGKAMGKVLGWLDQLRSSAARAGYEFLFFGDYAITPVSGGAVFPNRLLRHAGLLHTRNIKGMSYPDYYRSRAFAMVDHQIAHVYISDPDDVTEAVSTLENVPGIDRICFGDALQELGIQAPRCGELVLIAAPGYWFAYPWWTNPAEAPDFSTHVDIHNKPGYDPCELFFGWPPPNVSQNTQQIKGTHGRTGAGTEVAWLSSAPLGDEPGDLVELAAHVKEWLSQK